MKKDVQLTKRILGRQTASPSQFQRVKSAVSKERVNEFFSKKHRQGSALNYYHLFWIFVISSVLGLVLETVYHFVVFGGYEARFGLVWGPFSPIYGCGAVFFTLVSRGRRVERKSRFIINVFLSCAIGGAVLEFVASWLMQTFFGVVSWDYSGTFLNFDGRTNLFFGVMWGLLGTAWICWCLPTIIRFIDRIPENRHVLATVLLSLFMALNILTTIMAVNRAYERSQGLPAQSQLEQLLDREYSDEFISERFENATILPEESS
ncbi:MAG: putative ABC transporter permease [Coriobacteriales bacterium]|nr:putative ABC transporter permease [Coriobacteriales bacterium]